MSAIIEAKICEEVLRAEAEESGYTVLVVEADGSLIYEGVTFTPFTTTRRIPGASVAVEPVPGKGPRQAVEVWANDGLSDEVWVARQEHQRDEVLSDVRPREALEKEEQ